MKKRSASRSSAVMIASVWFDPKARICAIASPIPSTSLAAQIMSRNSVPKSPGRAVTVPGTWARSPSALTSTPAATSASITAGAVLAVELPVEQQALHRAADAGAPGLGVQHHLGRHRRVGGRTDIDVADAFEMGKDRHPRLALDEPDEALAAARHDHVDMLGHRQHLRHRGAVAHRHELDRVLRQPGLPQPERQAGMDRLG